MSQWQEINAGKEGSMYEEDTSNLCKFVLEVTKRCSVVFNVSRIIQTNIRKIKVQYSVNTCTGNRVLSSSDPVSALPPAN